jgi:DNA replication protein DnaC
MSTLSPTTEGLDAMLRSLRLAGIRAHHQTLLQQAAEHGWTHEVFLNELLTAELDQRGRSRVQRNLKASGLPPFKTLATLDLKRYEAETQTQLRELCTGAFVHDAVNVLAFGLPGRGKTHMLAAIGHELVRQGHRVLFTPTYQLVQRLLLAKRELQLERALKKLDRFAAVILDDIGYVQQDRAEMEVLFTFLAQRYERRSVLISSNLLFSDWDQIFKDPMTTVAAIDRVVHHSVILELTGTSYRGDEALKRQGTSPSVDRPKP